MINSRFREVVWTGGICAAALAFYMVSQTVAAKRAELSGVERKIAATNQEIRQLRTEIDTRGGLAQIESWNATVYGLQAPGAEQFVSSSIKLVALTQPLPRMPALPLDPAIVASHGAVSQVSLNVIEDSGMGARTPRPIAGAAPPPVSQPSLRQANYVQARPSALAPAAPSPVQEVALRKPARATALGDDFLADLGDEGSTGRSRKVKP
ncbi:hypothetical protein [Sphingomonas sp. SRS2]|uniref:hypothetical protein n=1 Tax=Sphingomonas sp. SRS2 TaxID=133190 RepID=UPI0006961413|nr:hypothetical protein [Sphingomonas sp. SRS2]